MTKEELENRAKEFVSKIASGTPQEMDYYANILVEFANETTKELENKVAILTNENKILKQGKTNVFAELNEETAESNAMLMNKVSDLEQENAELEAQIEKMKCCTNCKHSRTEYEHCKTDKHEKWEIKENEKE